MHKLVLSGELGSVGNFAPGLAGRNRPPTRVTIAVRPRIGCLGATVEKPGYSTS